MQSLESTARVETYDYDDRTVIAADLGPETHPSVDVLDDTAIVVLDDGRQYDVDLPDGDVEAVNKNGVVTLEVKG